MIVLGNRFERIHYEKTLKPSKFSDDYAIDQIEILKDLNTGVLYCASRYASSIAMTPLLGSDGKPIIDKSE